MNTTNLDWPLLVLVCLMAESTPAHAYLDPSTGSMVVSAIVGILASLVLAIKTYWYRLTSLFRRRQHEPQQDPARSPAADEEPPR